MIRFTGNTRTGGVLVGLGLTRRNCELLLQHKPIEIDLQADLKLKWNGSILLLAGETEESLTSELSELITSETKLHISPVASERRPPVPEGLGATGEFPHGRVSPQDEGEIKMAVGYDPTEGIVRMEFGKPVGWIGMSPREALAMAQRLVNAAREATPKTHMPGRN